MPSPSKKEAQRPFRPGFARRVFSSNKRFPNSARMRLSCSFVVLSEALLVLREALVLMSEGFFFSRSTQRLMMWRVTTVSSSEASGPPAVAPPGVGEAVVPSARSEAGIVFAVGAGWVGCAVGAGVGDAVGAGGAAWTERAGTGGGVGDAFADGVCAGVGADSTGVSGAGGAV